jgi:signal peptidase II
VSHVPSPVSAGKGRIFWPILLAIVVCDVVTKAIAAETLGLQRVPHDVIGEYLRFTLVYNPGAAFGLHVGEYSRWVFLALTIGALLILGRLYVSAPSTDRPRIISLALVCGGAIGNLIDRITSNLGVVDFLDVGIGDTRWPTFNVADMAVSIGAFMLAVVLWAEDRPSEDESSRSAVVASDARRESGEAA